MQAPLFPSGRPPLIGSEPGASPPGIPPGHVGPFVLPGSGRLVWWTGRVAIGLRHQPRSETAAPA